MIFPLSLVVELHAAYKQSKLERNQLTQLQWGLNPKPQLALWPQYFNINSPFFNAWKLVHFCFMALIFAFSILIMPVNFIVKIIIVSLLVYITTAPLFAQFFRPALPVLAWVFLFFNSKNIPLAMRPPITVTVLPSLENMLFGGNLSENLAKYPSTFKDVLAWLPYGIIHFSLPFITAALIFLFGPPTALQSFGWSFGYMNLFGVIVQNLIFSCAPPWYKVLHGLDKANYSMKGSPGGLARIDKLLGLDLYTTGFTNSPLIFGAMPSLHSGCSTMDAIWLSYLWPKLTPLFACYVLWLWYSTMYLTHHYFIDVVVGSNLAYICFMWSVWKGVLPINKGGCRWNYKEIEMRDWDKEEKEFHKILEQNKAESIVENLRGLVGAGESHPVESITELQDFNGVGSQRGNGEIMSRKASRNEAETEAETESV
ncbi:inositol phosphorylceramide synthase [Martiniozyma asiatica (nom. inval.)]|nr:inositol phosphorylceramide synthase [Martiniozyma asiatica]